MKLPDPSRAAVIRDAILRARRVHQRVLDELVVPAMPAGLDEQWAALWASYDRLARAIARQYAPMNVLANQAYWRTLAIALRGHALHKEWQTYALPPRTRHAVREQRRRDRRIRHGH